MIDPVTDPMHYRAKEYECQDIQDALCETLWHGHPKVVRLANGLKYLWRCCSKGKFEEDVRKCCKELLTAIHEDWRMRISQEDWQTFKVWQNQPPKYGHP